MARQVVILGAGAVGKYISYILSHDADVEIVGFTDQNPDLCGTEIDGKPVLGPDEVIPELYTKGVRHAVVGAGIPEVRSKLGALATTAGLELTNAIHPSALVPPGATLGKGAVLAAGVILSFDSVLEDNTWLGMGVVVGHECRIGGDCLVGGRAAVGSDVEIGERVLVGWGSVVGREVQVGRGAIIGSGANVIHSVPPRAVVVGNPAKVIRYRDRQETCG